MMSLARVLVCLVLVSLLFVSSSCSCSRAPIWMLLQRTAHKQGISYVVPSADLLTPSSVAVSVATPIWSFNSSSMLTSVSYLPEPVDVEAGVNAMLFGFTFLPDPGLVLVDTASGQLLWRYVAPQQWQYLTSSFLLDNYATVLSCPFNSVGCIMSFYTSVSNNQSLPDATSSLSEQSLGYFGAGPTVMQSSGVHTTMVQLMDGLNSHNNTVFLYGKDGSEMESTLVYNGAFDNWLSADGNTWGYSSADQFAFFSQAQTFNLTFEPYCISRDVFASGYDFISYSFVDGQATYTLWHSDSPMGPFVAAWQYSTDEQHYLSCEIAGDIVMLAWNVNSGTASSPLWSSSLQIVSREATSSNPPPFLYESSTPISVAEAMDLVIAPTTTDVTQYAAVCVQGVGVTAFIRDVSTFRAVNLVDNPSQCTCSTLAVSNNGLLVASVEIPVAKLSPLDQQQQHKHEHSHVEHEQLQWCQGSTISAFDLTQL